VAQVAFNFLETARTGKHFVQALAPEPLEHRLQDWKHKSIGHPSYAHNKPLERLALAEPLLIPIPVL
jgi:hypothetical protein